MYDNVSAETAPFGSDEGSDLLWESGGRRRELSPDASISDLMKLETGELDALIQQMQGIDHLDQAAAVRGAGFTLLWLSGRLNRQDRDRVLRFLDYEIETTADPGWLPAEVRDDLVSPLRVQRDDLLSWRDPATTR